MRYIHYVAFGLLFLFLLFAGLTIWQWKTISRFLEVAIETSKDGERTSPLKTPEDFLEYIVAHPQNVSLVAYEISNPEQGIFYRADEKHPLASTIKILILAEYARQVEQGIISPDEKIDLNSVDVYYLPNKDGGAHPQALKEFQDKKYVNAANQIDLRHIAWAMIRYSSNAATDYLIERLGRENIEKLPSRLGLPNQDVPLPIIGQFLSWDDSEISPLPAERLKIYQAMSQTEYANLVYNLMSKWRNDAAFRDRKIKHLIEFIGIEDQQAMAQALNPGGTAKGYAQIMERIYTNSLISPAVSQIMREYLEWPMKNEPVREKFDALSAKGGSLPGIVTETMYAKRKNGERGRVVALFFENIPTGVWLQLMQTYAQQEFELKLLTDKQFFETVRQKLSVVARLV
ncbi:serine hydrolase [Argonema antarcticum]|uniref:serine hydrolase n=1 Tax=Argonema antarcticum TaxID=2942763 RepID=UPI002013BB5E|nr:serine hydrolase [Argonema antarcticum]MCL1474668.1 class A beta-lactamase-related serine hydrolase [Argonema antarcticum A004/B2]